MCVTCNVATAEIRKQLFGSRFSDVCSPLHFHKIAFANYYFLLLHAGLAAAAAFHAHAAAENNGSEADAGDVSGGSDA
jgi:hypothetical protein